MDGSRHTSSPLPPGGRDDVDRLFGRLAAVPPPRDFSAGVMLAIKTQRLTRPQMFWLVAQTLAVVCLAALAYAVGQALVGTGTLDLISALVTTPEVAGEARADTIAALVTEVPWLELAGLGIMLVSVGVTTRGLVQALGRATGGNGTAEVSGGAR